MKAHRVPALAVPPAPSSALDTAAPGERGAFDVALAAAAATGRTGPALPCTGPSSDPPPPSPAHRSRVAGPGQTRLLLGALAALSSPPARADTAPAAAGQAPSLRMRLLTLAPSEARVTVARDPADALASPDVEAGDDDAGRSATSAGSPSRAEHAPDPALLAAVVPAPNRDRARVAGPTTVASPVPAAARGPATAPALLSSHDPAATGAPAVVAPPGLAALPPRAADSAPTTASAGAAGPGGSEQPAGAPAPPLADLPVAPPIAPAPRLSGRSLASRALSPAVAPGPAPAARPEPGSAPAAGDPPSLAATAAPARPDSVPPAQAPARPPPPGAPATRPQGAPGDGVPSAPAEARSAHAARVRAEPPVEAPVRVGRAPTFVAPSAGRDLAAASALTGHRPAGPSGRGGARTEDSPRDAGAPPASLAAPPPPGPASRAEGPHPAAPVTRTATPDPRPEVPAGSVLLPQTAHVRFTSGALGDIALHLRLRDGRATVRLEADNPGDLRGRAPELARALAAEGLSLARLDVERREALPAALPHDPAGDPAARHSGGGRGGGAEEGAPGDPHAPPPRPPTPAPRPRRTGHDVTA